LDAILEYAAACYGVSPSVLSALDGGHFQAVYALDYGREPCVLRITPPNEEITAETTRAVIAWMRLLAAHDVPVPIPLASVNGRMVERYTDSDGEYLLTVQTRAPGVLAQDLDLQAWTDALVEALGRAVGRMHAVAAGGSLPEVVTARPTWQAVGNCYGPHRSLERVEPGIRARYESALERVLALPRDGQSWGLVHVDLHFGNLFVDTDSGTITLFDFDDYCYGWYMMDVAMQLMDILVLYGNDRNEADRAVFTSRFLRHYLQGYTDARELGPGWADQLNALLALLEFVLYIDVSPHYDPADDDRWMNSFVPGRRERILAGTPYVAVDWDAL
jgi:Ser/Thr protein kinase RdoA (MazF antagonist)